MLLDLSKHVPLHLIWLCRYCRRSYVLTATGGDDAFAIAAAAVVVTSAFCCCCCSFIYNQVATAHPLCMVPFMVWIMY